MHSCIFATGRAAGVQPARRQQAQGRARMRRDTWELPAKRFDSAASGTALLQSDFASAGGVPRYRFEALFSLDVSEACTALAKARCSSRIGNALKTTARMLGSCALDFSDLNLLTAISCPLTMSFM